MKIVVTGTRGIPGIMGGVETHCEELFPRIARKGFDVTVIRRKSYVHDTLRQYEGITLVDLATPKKKSFEAIVHTFRAVLEAKKLKAEIIHIHAVGPALLTPVARLLGLKVVFTHHGPDYDRDKWGAAAKTVLRLGEMMGARFANEIIVISNVINDMLIRKYHRKECHLIYNGVPAPQIVDFPEYLEETGVEKGKYYVHDTLRQYEGITLVDLATPKKKSFEAIVHTFRAVLEAKKLKAEIIHIHAVGPALLTPVARLLGLKVVFTHHGPDYDRDKWGAAAKTVLRLGEMMGARFANEIIVISNVINDMLIRKYHRKECHLIYNGVPAPQIVDFPEYLEETGVEKGKYIFSMCRFVPEKNLHHLIEAFSKTDNKGCRLVLAGDTDFEDEYSAGLKKYAREQGVVLTGFIKGKKLHALLTHARCFVLPSSHEGLPIALLEAMSYRLPVIVSDIPANLEVGLEKEAYFPVGDIAALAQKLQQNIDAPYRQKEYPMEKYDWDAIAEQTAAVYEKCAKPRPER